MSRLRADDLQHCMQELQSGDVDFVIAYAPEGEATDSSQSIVIGKDRLVPVCKPKPDGMPLYDFNSDEPSLPFVRFGDGASISQHLEPLLNKYKLGIRLQSVYENSMAGALLIRTREGIGVAWLPESLVEADLASNTLVRAGSEAWTVPLDIRLHRNKRHSNAVTQSIWNFLEKGLLL